MRKQNTKPSGKDKAKNNPKTAPVKSKHKLSAEDVAKALAAKTPTPFDIASMQSIQLKDEQEKNEPIVLSDTWYEFSVFCSKFSICVGTANNWLRNGWLAYAELGKLRFINKADIEDTMMFFRRPARRG